MRKNFGMVCTNYANEPWWGKWKYHSVARKFNLWEIELQTKQFSVSLNYIFLYTRFNILDLDDDFYKI